MTSPAQTALDFCREVLRWERPVDRKYGERERDPHGKPSQAWSPYIFDYHGKNPQFHYFDLNTVMAAVQEWCDKGGAFLVLGYGRYAKGDWDASISTSAGGVLFLNRSPCHALLAACVQANRKLKQPA